MSTGIRVKDMYELYLLKHELFMKKGYGKTRLIRRGTVHLVRKEPSLNTSRERVFRAIWKVVARITLAFGRVCRHAILVVPSACDSFREDPCSRKETSYHTLLLS